MGDAGNRRGRYGERAAERHMVRRGWSVLARRWRGAGGELDLVLARGRVVAMCEVKTRGNAEALAEPLTAAQRARIGRAAEAYLAAHPHLRERRVRVDLITVHPGRLRARVRHHAGYAADLNERR